MINDQSVLALIPARGGSKRLPGKNVRLLAGRPLIQWSIDAAINSGYVDRVMVSTDSEDIAKVAESGGANVPFMRSSELATDTATSMQVIDDAIARLSQSGEHYDILVLLQPTSPLRTSYDIDAALELFERRQASSIVSVCLCEHSPLWSAALPDNLSLDGFMDNSLVNRRSQDLGDYYRLNGAIYIAEPHKLQQQGSFFFADGSFGYAMPRERSVDIDTELDFRFVEFLVSQNSDC